MKDSELPQEIRELISASVPTLDALELLMTLARTSEQTWTLDQLLHGIPTLKPSEARQYLQLFVDRRLLTTSPEGVQFAPGTPAVAQAMSALCRAYNERPVTLIRTIYAIADERKIQSFADAFRLKRDS